MLPRLAAHRNGQCVSSSAGWVVATDSNRVSFIITL